MPRGDAAAATKLPTVSGAIKLGSVETPTLQKLTSSIIHPKYFSVERLPLASNTNCAGNPYWITLTLKDSIKKPVAGLIKDMTGSFLILITLLFGG